VHVVFRRERLPLRNVLLLGTEDRRSIFAVPRGEAVYVGTTDTTWSEGHTAWPRIDPADVSYLVAPLHRHLATHGLGPLDVFAAWAGLRPLVAEPGKPPTEISRKDEVTIGPAGVVSIAGGKLTATGRWPRRPSRAQRRTPALPSRRTGCPSRSREAREPRISRRWRAAWSGCLRRWRPVLCGPMAARLPRCSRGADLLVAGASLVEGEVDWAVDVEDALRLEDVLYRRTGAALYDPVGREALLAPVAELMARKLGWSDARRASEVAAVRERLVEDLAFKDHSKGAADPASGSEERA
jgi:glycerol-3-phosphate dehydrogenase